MPINAKYLFISSMDVAPDKEALFNEVYDTEHVPNLAEVPGRDARIPVVHPRETDSDQHEGLYPIGLEIGLHIPGEGRCTPVGNGVVQSIQVLEL